ncbi:hypothetical protein BDW68DRAFT_5212 [Aspergillus falconensis]
MGGGTKIGVRKLRKRERTSGNSTRIYKRCVSIRAPGENRRIFRGGELFQFRPRALAVASKRRIGRR